MAASKGPGRRIHAIVPARGGSKGLPRKNLRRLAGRPLIAYSIDAGRRCPLIDRCLLSTEDAEIAETGRVLGAEVVPRPPALATDDASTADVVAHVLGWLAEQGDEPDVVVLLQPTSPLRTARNLTACLEAFVASGARSAISVAPCGHHPYKHFRLAGGRLRPLFGHQHLHKPRQQLPEVVRQNGAIYAVDRLAFLEQRAFFIEPVAPFLMRPEESVDVDSELDLRLAELLLADRPPPGS